MARPGCPQPALMVSCPQESLRGFLSQSGQEPLKHEGQGKVQLLKAGSLYPFSAWRVLYHNLCFHVLVPLNSDDCLGMVQGGGVQGGRGAGDLPYLFKLQSVFFSFWFFQTFTSSTLKLPLNTRIAQQFKRWTHKMDTIFFRRGFLMSSMMVIPE